MQINFNNHTNPPTFKAQFSNDRETKSILKRYSKLSPMLFYSMVNLIEKTETKDQIALKNDYGSITAINLATPNHRQSYASPIDLYYLVNDIELSNRRKVKTYTQELFSPKNRKKYENSVIPEYDYDLHLHNNFSKVTGSAKLKNNMNNIDKQIAKFENDIINAKNQIAILKNEKSLISENIKTIEANYAKDLYEKKFGNK